MEYHLRRVLAAAIVKSLTDDVLIRETSLLLWSLAGMALGIAARRDVAGRATTSSGTKGVPLSPR